jgi:uncharacterized membrane protein
MPTDEASATIEIEAPPDRVLAVIRDVESQPRWVPEIRSAEVVDRNADGTPATATFRASTPVGSDEYTLAYTHRPDGLDWHLLEGRLQSGQDASYRVRPLGADRTEVSFDLRITHGLPLPGFVRRRVVGGLAKGTVEGLARFVESGPALV